MTKRQLRTTIRFLPEKAHVYPEFKTLVIEHLHSDVCYVITELMEAFTQAVKQTEGPVTPVTLKFLKQNIQINMGCTFNYNTKKTKRLPQDKTQLSTSLNHILPNLLEKETWQNLKPEAQAFWFKRMVEEGIIPKDWKLINNQVTPPQHPSVSTPTRARNVRPIPIFFVNVYDKCHGLLVRLLRWFKRNLCVKNTTRSRRKQN